MNSLDLLRSAKEQLYLNPDILPACEARAASRFTLADIEAAEARLTRFAPLIAALFPETEAAGGIIESPLTEIPAMGRRLGFLGRLFLKRDSDLPIAGSVKARGGVYEVLKHTEDLLKSKGLGALLDFEGCDMRERISAVRAALAGSTVQVGSTGNLGLSIGIMSAALGYKAVVHMSCDAKQWKKDMLRQKGVTVIEYEGDYSSAVKLGRESSKGDPDSYFVDDESSIELFMGYAVAALRLKRSIEAETGVRDPKLCVYLPCGVGGAPGGICFGLKTVFGDSVKIFFAEPTQAPCMLAAFLCKRPVPVTELGLTGATAADGLAVGTASALAYDAVKALMDGEFTVDDERLQAYQRQLYTLEGLFIEPSSAIAFDASRYLGRGIEDGKGLIHIAWATGGRLVPEDERRKQLCIRVSAALIWHDGRFMICRRPPHKARGGLWEFVGGKLEAGETGEEALVRECREELGVDIAVDGEFMSLTHNYPDLTVRLTLYNSHITRGEPKLLEHTEIKWITPAEADEYEFCPADAEILKKLKSSFGFERQA